MIFDRCSLLSSSGKPYATPAGHTLKWVNSVSWHSASAFDPPSYQSLVSSSSAVVHTLGILLENANYKAAVQGGNVLSLLQAFAGGVRGAGNPLQTEQEKRRGYDGMNRDAGMSFNFRFRIQNVTKEMLDVAGQS